MSSRSTARGRAASLAASALVGLLLVGCPGRDLRPDAFGRFDPTLIPLVNGADAPVGVGVVVRATRDEVLVAMAPAPPDQAVFLALGDERLAATVWPGEGFAVLHAPAPGTTCAPSTRSRRGLTRASR